MTSYGIPFIWFWFKDAPKPVIDGNVDAFSLSHSLHRPASPVKILTNFHCAKAFCCKFFIVSQWRILSGKEREKTLISPVPSIKVYQVKFNRKTSAEYENASDAHVFAQIFSRSEHFSLRFSFCSAVQDESLHIFFTPQRLRCGWRRSWQIQL